MSFENQFVPLVSKDEPSASKANPPPSSSDRVDNEEIEKLMEQLKQKGFGNSQFFSARDFEGLSPEEMAAKVSSSLYLPYSFNTPC